jgi:hypothetical protein
MEEITGTALLCMGIRQVEQYIKTRSTRTSLEQNKTATETLC